MFNIVVVCGLVLLMTFNTSAGSLETEVEQYLNLSEESVIYVNIDNDCLEVYPNEMSDGFRNIDLDELSEELQKKVRLVGIKGSSVKL